MKKIYLIQYVSYYAYSNPCDPIYEILNHLYFKTKKEAEEYVKSNTNLKTDEYYIEELLQYKEEK